LIQQEYIPNNQYQSVLKTRREIFRRLPEPGKNIIVIGHNDTLSRIGIRVTLEQGDAAVLKVDDDNKIHFVARVHFNYWIKWMPRINFGEASSANKSRSG
jgi:hypothetical protein